MLAVRDGNQPPHDRVDVDAFAVEPRRTITHQDMAASFVGALGTVLAVRTIPTWHFDRWHVGALVQIIGAANQIVDGVAIAHVIAALEDCAAS